MASDNHVNGNKIVNRCLLGILGTLVCVGIISILGWTVSHTQQGTEKLVTHITEASTMQAKLEERVLGMQNDIKEIKQDVKLLLRTSTSITVSPQ